MATRAELAEARQRASNAVAGMAMGPQRSRHYANVLRDEYVRLGLKPPRGAKPSPLVDRLGQKRRLRSEGG